MWRFSLFVAAMVLAGSPASIAASCAEEMALLTKQYDLKTGASRAQQGGGPAETPATMESRGIPPADTLSGSARDVPPEGGRGAAVEPPSPGPGVAPGTPDVGPGSTTPSTASGQLSAEKRTEMQALLNAAQAAAGQGDEAECFRHLGEARAIPEPG